MKSMSAVIIIAALIIGGAIVLSKNKSSSGASSNESSANSSTQAASGPTLGSAADKSLVRGDERHVYGDANAPVSLTVFSDFQCPYCGKVAPILKGIVDKNKGKVKLVFRDFPLPNHQFAQKAAEAAEAAGAQNKDKFWELHDKMFANQSALTTDDLIKYAGEIKLDTKQFTNDLNSGKYADVIKKEFAVGNDKLNVQGTPTIYINDKPAEFQSYSDIETLVNKAIAG